jgi:hypothetical protein
VDSVQTKGTRVFRLDPDKHCGAVHRFQRVAVQHKFPCVGRAYVADVDYRFGWRIRGSRNVVVGVAERCIKRLRPVGFVSPVIQAMLGKLRPLGVTVGAPATVAVLVPGRQESVFVVGISWVA